MQVCTSLQTDNHASTPTLSCFLQAGCPSCRPTNSIKALKTLFNIKQFLCYFFATCDSEEIEKKLFDMKQSCTDMHILASASTSLPSKFQDFPGPCSWISRTFQVLEILQTQFRDFPGGMKTQHQYGCYTQM